MQFVKCKFRPEDNRTYTYVWGGEPLSPGDMVKVADNRDPTAWKRVEVVDVTDEVPPFECKPVLGRADEPELATDDPTTLRDLDEAAFEGWFSNRD